MARPPRSPSHQAGTQLRPVALLGEAQPQTKAEAIALQVPQAKGVALKELQAAVWVLLAATLLLPRLRLLVHTLQAALEVFLVAALPPRQRRLQLLPLQAAAQLLLLAPQAASSPKAERAVAAPEAHICLLGNSQRMG